MVVERRGHASTGVAPFHTYSWGLRKPSICLAPFNTHTQLPHTQLHTPHTHTTSKTHNHPSAQEANGEALPPSVRVPHSRALEGRNKRSHLRPVEKNGNLIYMLYFISLFQIWIWLLLTPAQQYSRLQCHICSCWFSVTWQAVGARGGGEEEEETTRQCLRTVPLLRLANICRNE